MAGRYDGGNPFEEEDVNPFSVSLLSRTRIPLRHRPDAADLLPFSLPSTVGEVLVRVRSEYGADLTTPRRWKPIRLFFLRPI
jgi:hypothetical protein